MKNTEIKKMSLSLADSYLSRSLKVACVAMFSLAASICIAQSSTSPNGLTVSIPNGYATIAAEDMRVQSIAGPVRWNRNWDGQEWKFNPYWESLSLSWKNLTGSQTADTTGGTIGGVNGGASSGGSANSGCWVWADEDWSPTITAGQAGPMLAERTTPFNRLMSESSTEYAAPVRISIDYASLCAGTTSSTGVAELEGIRRQSELYLGEAGRYAFSNRAVIEKRPVRAVSASNAATLDAQLAAGSIALSLTTNAKGYRWIHKDGNWIDYNTQGQVVSYGDKNDNTIWLVRDTAGTVRGVVDGNGRVLYTLHYTGKLLTEVRDAPVAGNNLDLPKRSVKYQYDASNRLTQVTDVRGNTIKYDYDALSHVVKITDQEGRAEQLVYKGGTVSQRTAADGAITDYVFEYDDTNKQFVSKITGPTTSAGRRIEDFTHNRVGKLVRVIANGRVEQEVRYDTASRIAIDTNARGLSTRIMSNEFDQVVEVVFPDGASQKRSYSALNLQLLEETDELAIKTQYQYDGKGNLVKKTNAVGSSDEIVAEYNRNSFGQVSQITRKGRTESNAAVTLDAIWRIEYNAIGQIQKTIDPEGYIRNYIYDRTGNLVRYTDPRGNSTTYDVDADGNLIKVTDPVGRTRSYQYDKVGNVILMIDARSKAIQAAYDAMNRRTQMVSPMGGTYKLQYNGQGLPISETDEDGRTSSAEFDNFLRLTKLIDGLGNATEYSYTIPDGSGAGTLGALYEPTEIKYPTFTQRQRYDQRERPNSDTLLNPTSLGLEGLVSSTEYDKRGQVKSDTDANGKTWFYTYDALGQLIETTDSLGNKTKAHYDARGNLIQITDAKGNVNKFEFDRNNRLIREVLPLGQATSYQYDEAGNVKERIDPNGYKATYVFDVANRLTEVKQYKPGNVLVRTTSYIWDATDNLTGWTDTDHSRNQTTSGTLTFDDANRKTGELITYPAGNTLAYGYAYSAAGYKTQLRWPDGTQIGYTYSAHGELEGIAIPGEGSISVNQFKWVAPVRVTLPGGTKQELTLDGLLNLEGLKVKTPNQQNVLNIANTYGKVQELKSSNRTDMIGNVSTTQSSTFNYDDETRLTKTTTDTGGLFGTDTENFTLDAVGNRIAHSKVNGAWTYDANNRLTQRGTGSDATNYQYDESGNLTQKTEPGNRISRYGYDTQNRLIEVKDGGNNLTARYGYDPMDRRVWREQYRDKNGNVLAQAKRTYYLYADEGLIAEASQDITLNADQTVSVSGSPTISAQYGPRPDAEFTTGILFVKTKNSNEQDIFAYYHHDQLGTPIQATDKQGNVVWAASYNPFGQASITTPNPSVDKPTINSSLRLPGQIEDSETGLHYNYRRYYDPSTGRYITQDPIGMQGGTNQYKYAEANPTNLSDPTGECPMCAVYALCVAQCMLEDVAVNAVTGECNNFGDSAKNCAASCLMGPLGRFAKWAKKGKNLPCAINSFPAETLVHVKPNGAKGKDAYLGKADLKPISQLKIGDEVLAFSEWKAKGTISRADERLTYEKVTDVFTSDKLQMLVHFSLKNGEKLTATDGHPFKTINGWRDAILLKKGDKLFIKGSKGAIEHISTIVDIWTEKKVLQVLNLEVANAHTFFVGTNGELVHNARCTPKMKRDWEKYYGKDWPNNPPTEKIRPNLPQDGHHKVRPANGGTNHPTNIEPMTPSDHTNYHKKNGYKY